MVKHLCRPDRDSIDVGANVGTYLHPMRRHSRRVYAFEPVPWLAKSLVGKFGPKLVVENIALSHMTSTTVLHIPVIDGVPVTGLSSLSDGLPGSGVPCQNVVVRTRPLDEIYGGSVGFMKIDVEGHEYSVLQGAHHTIARSHPRVLVEAEESHDPGCIGRVEAFFRSFGYRGYFIFRRRLTPIEYFDPQRLQRAEDIAGYTLGVPRSRFEHYINNFLFLPPDEPNSTLAQLERALA